MKKRMKKESAIDRHSLFYAYLLLQTVPAVFICFYPAFLEKMSGRSFEGRFADPKSELDIFGVAFVRIRHLSVMPFQIMQKQRTVFVHCFFFWWAERNIQMSVFTDESDPPCDFLPHPKICRHVFSVQKSDPFFSRNDECALIGHIVDGPRDFPADFDPMAGFCETAHFFIYFHGDSQASGLIHIEPDPDLLPGPERSDGLRVGEKYPPLRPCFHKRAESRRQKDFRIADPIDGDLRKAHAGCQAVMGIVIQKDPNFIALPDFIRLLLFMQKDIIRGVSRPRIKKSAKRSQTGDCHFCDGIFLPRQWSDCIHIIHELPAIPAGRHRDILLPALRPRDGLIHNDGVLHL